MNTLVQAARNRIGRINLISIPIRPAAVYPFPDSEAWFYGGAKVTQYWKQPKGELRDRFYEGQQFIFGVSTQTPAELTKGF